MVEIQSTHTNITRIFKNGVELKGCLCDDCSCDSVMTDQILYLKLIYNLAKTIDLSLIEPTFKKVIDYNTAIANERITNYYGLYWKTYERGN